jgi:D-alanyl-lipoteichoic acid acyltransferase DltB (MBOAT superfamily)
VPSLGVALVGTYAFAWQIYADFSGYSDIARGSAQLMGFHFMVNFRQPYLSTSLQDFWRRWHISLSTWLRDYLYIPLGGNRKGEARRRVNLMTTMVLGGLWHGANWTYVVWGAIHGTGLALERRLIGATASRTSTAVRTWASRVLVFHLVCLAWIFFRAASLHDAVAFLRGTGNIALGGQFVPAMTFLAIFTLPLFAIDVLLESRDEEYVFQRMPGWSRVAVGASYIGAVIALSANTNAAFIYFQF